LSSINLLLGDRLLLPWNFIDGGHREDRGDDLDWRKHKGDRNKKSVYQDVVGLGSRLGRKVPEEQQYEPRHNKHPPLHFPPLDRRTIVESSVPDQPPKPQRKERSDDQQRGFGKQKVYRL